MHGRDRGGLAGYEAGWPDLYNTMYSQTSDSEPSEIGTQYNKPLYKGRFSRSQIIGLPMVLIHFEPPRRGQPLYKGQKILFPKCPLEV